MTQQRREAFSIFESLADDVSRRALNPIEQLAHGTRVVLKPPEEELQI